MAVRDDDPVDATLEGAPVMDDGAPDSEVLFASAESPLAKPAAPAPRFAPPPVTLPDMPALSPPSASGSTKRKKKKSKSVDSMPETAPVATIPAAPPPRAPAPLAAMPSAPKPQSASASATTTASDLLATAPPAPPAPRASYNAAATVVASFKDIAAAAGVKLDLTGDGAAVGDGIAFDASGEGGIIFDASAEGAPIVDDHGFGDGDGATRPDVARFQDRAPPPSPAAPPTVAALPGAATAPPTPPRAPTPPPTKAPLPSPADQTSLPPPRPKPPAPADQTMLPPPTSLPGSPSFSMPRTSTRGESRGGAAGVGGVLDPPVATTKPPGGPLDPPLPPRKDTRGPVAGVGGPLDPPVTPRRDPRQVAADGPTDPTRGRKARKSEPSRGGDVVVVSDSDAGGGPGRGIVAFVVVAAIAVAVVLLTRGGDTSGQTLGPREARALSERARAVLVLKARSDVEDPVRGVVRTLVGEGGRAIVVRDAAADAFALPDGTVVVTDGLLLRLGSDGQLAAVCAHVLAHHQLGHVAGLSDALDGPALVAALRAPGSFDEAAADTAAAALLVKGGWKTSALVDAQAALPEDSAWVRRHQRRPEQIAGAVGAGGGSRDDRDWYRQKITDVLRQPAAAPATPATPATPTTGD